MFVIEYIIEGIPVCDVVSRITKTMVAKMAIQATENTVELFMQTLAVLAIDPIS